MNADLAQFISASTLNSVFAPMGTLLNRSSTEVLLPYTSTTKVVPQWYVHVAFFVLLHVEFAQACPNNTQSAIIIVGSNKSCI